MFQTLFREGWPSSEPVVGRSPHGKRRPAEMMASPAMAFVGEGRGKHHGAASNCSGLGVFFRKLAQRKCWNIAVCATARKLVTIAWLMLNNGEPYRYANPTTTQRKLSRLPAVPLCYDSLNFVDLSLKEMAA